MGESIKDTLKQLAENKLRSKKIAKDIDIESIKSNITDNPFDSEKLTALSQELIDLATNLKNRSINPENKKAASFEHFTRKVLRDGEIDKSGEDTQKKLFQKYYERENVTIAAECFHDDTQECSETIIDAHSIQENGSLKLIADLIGNQYMVLGIEKHIDTQRRTLQPIPISTASTFKGFCHKHDEIFSIIEDKNKKYDGSTHFNFLHSYRSFAQSYHRVTEKFVLLDKTVKNGSDLSELLGSLSDLFGQIAPGVSLDEGLGISEGSIDLEGLKLTQEQIGQKDAEKREKYKVLINDYLKNKQYNKLDYIVHELNHACPFTCSSWITEHVVIGNQCVIEDVRDPYYGYPLMITVLPISISKTVIILARFNKDQVTQLSFDRLRKLSKTEFELELSAKILNQVDNLFCSPKFWAQSSDVFKKEFLTLMTAEKNQWFFSSSLNLFSDEFVLC